MLKPVTLLALDEPSAALAAAVQQRIAAACGLDELAQSAFVSANLAGSITSIHARRQAPDSPLRSRDDVSARETILVVLSAGGEARKTLIETAREIRQLYDMRRLAAAYTLEALCLMPELMPSPDYGAAYSLVKMLSADNPFDAVWLLDATNGNRVKFGPVSDEAYAVAVAGALLHEPEMSGAPASHRPRGLDPIFSSFGYAELVFPRDVALQRLEPRLAAELMRDTLLRSGAGTHPQLAAKQFVLQEAFATPLSRIGIEAGQSLFNRFQPRTFVNEHTRSADELIAAVRAELKTHRDSTHVQNLTTLATQGDQTAGGLAALVISTVDETLDRDDYSAAIGWFDALLDPLPDLRADAGVAPRNLITELNAATAALDARVRFAPNIAASDAARKRIRELDNLIADQQLVADVLTPVHGAAQLADMQAEKDSLSRSLPDVIFAEETENNAARNAAREAEAARLAEETLAREQQLRELFQTKPRAELAVAEALELRRSFLWRHLWAGLAGAAAVAAFCLRFNLTFRTLWIGLGLFAIYTAFRYVTDVISRIRAAREYLARLVAQIDATDKAKNAAHNDELQFEYDVAHRRTAISVLRRTRELARTTLDALRVRVEELEALAASFVPATIAGHRLSIAIVDDADVDAWYDHTADDRRHLFSEFPIRRSESRRLALDELRARITAYTAAAFEPFRKLTLAEAAALTPEASLNQRLKRFAEYSAPLIELRDDDLPAQQAMQRDTTLWISDATFLGQIQRRLPDANAKPALDPLRIQAVSRVLHYPAYVLGQIEYYRSEYDPAQHAESAEVEEPLPQLREPYGQVLEFRED